MSHAFSVTFLLLFTTVVESLGNQTVKEEEGLPSQMKQERAERRTAEILHDGGSQDLCNNCKSLVTKVKKKMGNDTPKANVAKLVDKICHQENRVHVACKNITGDIKDKLSEAIADGGDPKSVCKKKVQLYKKKPPPRPETRYR